MIGKFIRELDRVAIYLNGMFDGDCLNVLVITNDQFEEAVFKSLCPRNCMIISNNDGRFNTDFNVFKDVLININGLLRLSRDKYSNEQMQKIRMVQQKYGKAAV